MTQNEIIDAQQRRISELEAALEVYADANNWGPNPGMQSNETVFKLNPGNALAETALNALSHT